MNWVPTVWNDLCENYTTNCTVIVLFEFILVKKNEKKKIRNDKNTNITYYYNV